MKKLLLFGNKKEKSKLMNLLHEAGCVDIAVAKKYDVTDYFVDEEALNDITKKITQLDFCFKFLKKNKDQAAALVKKHKIEYKPFKDLGLLDPKPSLTFEEFTKSDEFSKEVFNVISKLEDLNLEQIKIKSEIQKAKALIAQIKPYENVECEFSKIKDTKHVSMLFGTITPSKFATNKAELDAIDCAYEVNETQTVIFVSILKDNESNINDVLSKMDFSLCTIKEDKKPKEIIDEQNEIIKSSDDAMLETVKNIAQYEFIVPKAKRLHDFYTLQARKLECEFETSDTKSSYLLEGWVPLSVSENLDKKLEESPLSLAYVIRDPQEGEVPPTLAVNNSVVTPYEAVTNMYAYPSYKEIDPNPFVAFFFFVFFGMMLSDAGYGVILTILTGIYLLKVKPPKGQANLIKVIFMGGISTIFWGILFGSYFGVSAKELGIWCWFNPIEKPINLMALSLVMGVFQMLFGVGINVVALFKQKHYLEGIANTSWFFLIVGLVSAFAPSFLKLSLGSWTKIVGFSLLGVGAFLLLLSGAVGKKGFKKVTGALSSVYGVVNFFSDLMSYARIFGLGLATAVIGMVFNEIGKVIMNLIPIKFIGVIFAIVILLVGHLFNVAINTLGAYVHNSRLQFVEFFGKFYTGGGRLYKPLGSEMKYYYIKPQEVKK